MSSSATFASASRGGKGRNYAVRLLHRRVWKGRPSPTAPPSARGARPVLVREGAQTPGPRPQTPGRRPQQCCAAPTATRSTLRSQGSRFWRARPARLACMPEQVHTPTVYSKPVK